MGTQTQGGGVDDIYHAVVFLLHNAANGIGEGVGVLGNGGYLQHGKPGVVVKGDHLYFFLKLMKELNEKLGMSFVYISHDLSTTRYIARNGRVCVMYLGQIVELGQIGDVISQPRHPYTRALIRAVPIPDPDFKGNDELPLKSMQLGSLENRGDGCAFYERCLYAGEACKRRIPYYYNDSGTWKTTNAATAEQALQSRRWDIVTLQQASHLSGQPASYETLERIQGAVRSYQPDAKMYWHMTWAYHPDTSNVNFVTYAKDQMTMYNAIVEAVRQKIQPNALIEGVIPAGTAIQNLRTYSIGDNMTMPDGFHLNDLGCYTVGLAWYAELTGLPLELVDYLPANVPDIQKYMTQMKQAVADAVKTPLDVTPSAQ